MKYIETRKGYYPPKTVGFAHLSLIIANAGKLLKTSGWQETVWFRHVFDQTGNADIRRTTENRNYELEAVIRYVR